MTILNLLTRRVLARTAFAAAILLAPGLTLAQTKVNLGYIPVLGSSQAFVIDGEGWAKQAGIDLTLTRFDSGPAMIQALASGQLDAYLAGVGPILVARAQGIDVKVLASAAIEELVMVGRGPLTEYYEPAKNLKDAVAQFTAKQGHKPKMGAQPAGSVPDTMIRYWLEVQNGVDLNAVEILGIGIDATQQAFLSGALDAAVVREPTVTIIRDREPKTKLLALGGEMFPNQPGSILAAVSADKPGRKELFETLLRLHIRATDLIIKEPKRAAPHILKVLGGGIVPLDVIERALAAPTSRFISDPAQIVQATGKMQDYQIKLGVLKTSVPIESIFDLEMYKRVQAQR